MTGYDSYRGGTGTPLVLLHGVQASWRIWRPVLPYLEPYHEVYAPTLPGHRGGMPIAADRAGFAGFADVLQEQLDDAGIPDAHLAGNSLGAAVALEFARRGRARSVVAIAPPGGWRTSRDIDRVIRLIRTGRRLALRPTPRRLLRRPALRRQFLRVGFERGDRIPALEFDDMLQDLTECSCVEAVLSCARRDGTTASFQPRCPIRIAWPQYDRTIPYKRYGSGFAGLIPGSEIVMLPGVGHVPMYDDPALVAQSILHVTMSGAANAPTTHR
ncbi:MAG TPA: alpha/beta fold hydrolase [Aldersonia sp.]